MIRRRQTAARKKHQNRTANGRLTRERVSRVIAQIGDEAKVVVRQPDRESGRRIKYASAHDLRRSCAERLINVGGREPIPFTASADATKSHLWGGLVGELKRLRNHRPRSLFS